MEYVLPFVVFAGFMLLFRVQAKRAGRSTNDWLAERNEAMVYTPGWWKPMAGIVALMVLGFIVYLTLDQGFRPEYLLAVPLFGGFFALAVVALSWTFKRQ
jgi:hypothetical protein